MLKKLTFAAFAAVSMSALAQTTTTEKQVTKTNDMGQTTTTTTVRTSTMDNGWNNGMMEEDAGWRQKFDTYGIASVDVNTISSLDRDRILRHELRNVSAGDAFTINDFLLKSPADQQLVLEKALIENFKQASVVRDEVAQSRFGTYTTYTWLSYPPLVWNDTPGSNSWASIPDIGYNGNQAATTTTTTTMTDDSNLSDQIAMTEDESRPMRMVMHGHGWRDIDYDHAIDILGAGLNETDRGVLHTIFHPNYDSSTNYDSEGLYTNEAVLDACIRTINSNASMIDGLTRYSWYRHFDPNYYHSSSWSW